MYNITELFYVMWGLQMVRVYTSQCLNVGETLILEEKAYHHIVRVLRMPLGETFILFNGLGGEYQVTISAIDKRRCEVRIISWSEVSRESSLKLHLLQGVAKGDKMDFILQKAVEIGVHSIQPLYMERSIGRLDVERQEKKHNHWQQIIIAACEQSGRTQLPLLGKLMTVDEYCQHSVMSCPVLLLDPYANQHLSNYSLESTECAVCIGAEGGLSERDIQVLQQTFQVQNITLGPRILRTETAGLAVMSVLQAQYGDW